MSGMAQKNGATFSASRKSKAVQWPLRWDGLNLEATSRAANYKLDYSTIRAYAKQNFTGILEIYPWFS